MKRVMVWILGAGLLLSAAPVFAQADPDLNAPPPDPNATPATTTAAPAASGPWTSDINARPLVLDPGKLEIHGAIPIFAITVPTFNMMGVQTGTSTSTAEGLEVGATYGLMPKLEGGIDYAIPLNPNGSASGALDLRVAYAAMHTDKMDLALSAALEFDFRGSTDAALELGGWLRYRLTPTVSLFTGNPALPYQLGFLGQLASVESNQLVLGFNNKQPIALSIPVGIGLQATPEVYLFAALNLADFYFANGGKTVDLLFADFIPIELGAFFSASDKLDLGVTFADDLEHAGDFFVITFAGRYFIK